MDISDKAAPDWPKSLWADAVENTAVNAPLDGDLRTDVAIIGAGFTGLRAALHLAEAGTSVAVMDTGDVGWGASGRNGGQVNPMLPFNSPARLRQLLGAIYFERLTEASLKSADELFSLIDTYQIECQARQNGWLRALHNERALRKAEADVKEWNSFGAGMTVARGEDVHRVSGTKSYEYGVITPRGGAVHPLMLAQGLAKAAARRGARIFGRTTANSLKQVDNHWQVLTDRGSIRSGNVIVATNGYSGPLVPKLDRSIIPLTPIQMATAPLPNDVIDSILPDGHTISDSRRVIMYARREPDNRIVYGGLGKRLGNGELGGFDWLRRDAERVFPQLKDAAWTHRWGGQIAITDDHLPHLHEPQKGLVIGLGYNGRGVAMSNVMGRVLAERVLGAAQDTLPFPTAPIKAIPYRSFKLMGLGSAVWFMRLLDAIETRS